jgi:hypothetical protein
VSKATVSKRISNQLLKKLSSEYNKEVRKEAQNKRPQILQLHDLNFINETLDQFIERGKGSKQIKNVTITKSDVTKARNIAKGYQANFVRSRKFKDVTETLEFAHIQEVLPNVAKDIVAGKSFIVSSFSTTGKIKQQIVDFVLKDKSKSLRTRVKAKIDRGHGAAGGTAISSLQIASAASLASSKGIDLAATPGLDDYLVNQFTEYGISLKNIEIIKEVLVEYETLVTPKGDLKGQYIPIITFQDFYANRGIDAREEKLILEIVRKFFTETVSADTLVNMEGSKSLKDQIEEVIALPLINVALKNTNVKTTIKKPRLSGKAGRKKAPSKKLKAGTAVIAAKRKAAKKSFTRKPAKDTQRSMFSVMAMINRKLPATVQKNMKYPALENRSGRFANSVRILDVVETRKGFPSFGYTYDKEPYQVFEQGRGAAPWATPDRDPRSLIDKSIREVAAELALGRFFTRRL